MTSILTVVTLNDCQIRTKFEISICNVIIATHVKIFVNKMSFDNAFEDYSLKSFRSIFNADKQVFIINISPQCITNI